MRARVWTGIGLGLLLAAAPVGAVTLPAAQRLTGAPVKQVRLPFTPPPRVGIIGQTPLTLRQVIELALSNNPELKAAGLSRDASRFTLDEARAVWEPMLSLTSGWRNSIDPIASVIGGGANGEVTDRTFQTVPAFSGLIPGSGGRYKIALTSSRVWTDNQFVTLNPQYPSALSFSFTQPLWRGLQFGDSRRRIAIARRNIELSQEQFRQTANTVVTQAVMAYWNLRFAEENLRVQVQAVRLAERSLKGNQRLAQRGLLAPIDVVAARTQVDQFKDAVYAAQSALTQAENDVKEMILPDGADPLWNSAIEAVTPVATKVPVIPLADAMKMALAARPEVAESNTALAVDEINSRYQQEQTKPQVNLVASFTSSGLAGQQVVQGVNPLTASFVPFITRLDQLSQLAGLPALPPIAAGSLPAALVGGPGQSFSNLGQWNYPTTAISLEISLPLRNRAAESALAEAKVEEARARLQKRSVEMQIQAQVRNALQQVTSAQERLKADEDARKSAAAQYASELRQFRAGLSSTFLVLERQTSMITARSRAAQAESALAEAIAQLREATGTMLEQHGVTLHP